jgi:hypothetical protein
MIAMPVHGRAETGMLCTCRRGLARLVFEQDVAECSSFTASAAREVDRADGGWKDVDHGRRPL